MNNVVLNQFLLIFLYNFFVSVFSNLNAGKIKDVYKRIFTLSIKNAVNV